MLGSSYLVAHSRTCPHMLLLQFSIRLFPWPVLVIVCLKDIIDSLSLSLSLSLTFILVPTEICFQWKVGNHQAIL